MALTRAFVCSSVHASWNTYFKNVDSGLLPGQVRACTILLAQPRPCSPPFRVPRQQAFLAPPDVQPGVQPLAGTSDGHGADIARVVHLIRAFQVRGHEVANLDPLNLLPRKDLPELDYTNYVRRAMPLPCFHVTGVCRALECCFRC